MVDPDPYSNGSMKNEDPDEMLITKNDDIDRSDQESGADHDAEDTNGDADDTEGKVTTSQDTVMNESFSYLYHDVDMINDTELKYRSSFFPDGKHVDGMDVNRSKDMNQLIMRLPKRELIMVGMQLEVNWQTATQTTH